MTYLGGGFQAADESTKGVVTDGLDAFHVSVGEPLKALEPGS